MKAELNALCPHCMVGDTPWTDARLINDSPAVFWQHAKDMHPDIWDAVKDADMRWMVDE